MEMSGEGARAGMGEDTSRLYKELHYLGPAGTYSHQVALDLLPRLNERGFTKIKLHPCDTIISTIEEATRRTQETGEVSWALLPYENNSNGPVTDSYNILFTVGSSSSTSTRIVYDYHLPVSHSLMCSKEVYSDLIGADGSKLDLKKLDVISSHSQALGQCSTFIQSHLRKGIECIATTSTGEAAKQLKEHQGNCPTKLHACISSRVCATPDVYDLVILQDNIQNSSKNVTRFLLLETSKKDDETPKTTSGKCTQWRSIVRLDTMAASRTLTTLLNKLTEDNGHQFSCHIRSIERRAKKDAVDGADDEVSGKEGHWPFIYLIEVEAEGSSHKEKANHFDDSIEVPSKRGRIDGDVGPTDFSTYLNNILTTISLDVGESPATSLRCLGVWPASPAI